MSSVAPREQSFVPCTGCLIARSRPRIFLPICALDGAVRKMSIFSAAPGLHDRYPQLPLSPTTAENSTWLEGIAMSFVLSRSKRALRAG